MTLHFHAITGALLLALSFGSSSAAAAEFAVDQSKSHIQVDVKATGHKFSGDLKKYSLKITGDAASMTPKTVELKWNFVDLITGNEKRDGKMLTWLEHGSYATGTFQLTSFSKQADGTTVAEGKLAFHGVSKTVTFPVTTERKGDELTVTGETSIDHRDFKLDKIRMVVLTVNPVVKVRFKLVGKVK